MPVFRRISYASRVLSGVSLATAMAMAAAVAGPAGPWVTPALAAVSAPAASSSGFLDLGDMDTIGQPVSVNSSDDVLAYNGVWHNGTFVTPDPVPGAKAGYAAMTMSDIDDSGTVVGYASRETPNFATTHAVYWNARTTTTPSFYPTFDDDSLVAACGAYFGSTFYGSDELTAVTPGGEAGGFVSYYQLPTCGGSSVPVTVASTGSVDTHVNGGPLQYIAAITPAYALGKGVGPGITPGSSVLYDRQTGVTTPTNVESYGTHALDNSGDVIGTDLTSRTVVEWSAGVETPFVPVTSTDTAVPLAINNARVVVGTEYPSATHSRSFAVRWTTPGTVAALENDPNVPAGWHLLTANAINAAGDITGEATNPDGDNRDYVLLAAKQSTLTATMSITNPPGGLGVGDSLAVPVTITNTGSTTLTGLMLGAGVTPSSELKVTKKPLGANGFSLVAGASATFPYTLKAVKAGTAALAVSVTGTAPGGAAVSASDTKTIAVVQRALSLRIVTTPGKVGLKVDDKGNVLPATVTVKVVLTNTTKTPLTSISLLSVTPSPADPRQALDKIGIARALLPVKIAKLAGGASVAKSFPLKVTGDGDYLVRALAIYAAPAAAGGNGRSFAQGGAFTATVPLLWFRASQQNGEKRVDAGSAWYVTGEVRNLSSWQTLCLPPLLPTFTGNAAGFGARKIGLDDPAPPLAGPLPPGKYLLFQQRIDTDANGGTRAGVELKPAATLGESGDVCGVLSTLDAPRIAAAKIAIAPTGTSFIAHVDNSGTEPEGAQSLEFFGALAKGSADVLAKGYQSTLVLAREYASIEALEKGLSNLSPAQVYARSAQALAALDKTLELTADFWLGMTLEEKQAFLDKVVSDVVAKTGKVWDGATAALQKAAQGWFEGAVRAYYGGDTSEMFKVLGGAAPGALATVAVETAKWEIGFALLKKAGQLTGISRRFTQGTKFISKLKDMPAGRILNFEELGRLWGLAKYDVLEFDRIATEEGVVIGVRGRAPVSVARLEEGAVWKHEKLKPKNVNAIDMEFLGFPSSDDGLVALRTYTESDKKAILAKIKSSGLSVAQQEVVLARARTRFGESSKYLKTIEGYAESKTIDVGFNYRENGLDLDTTTALRKFALDSEKLGDGGRIFRPLQENPALDGLAETGRLPKECVRRLAAVLCRVTGDMDGVYVTYADGSALTEAKRAKVYARLAAVGWQHPETLTWIENDGKFLFGAKNSILQGLEKGGEAMVEFGPDGITRSTYLDLAKSRLFRPDFYYLNVNGGYYTAR